MTSRERIKAVLEHREADRVPVQDSPWGATVSRWHREGLPEEIPVEEYFGYELIQLGADLSARFPIQILEKNENYILTTTPDGGKAKNFRDYSTTPEVVDTQVKTKEDWFNFKPRLQSDYKRIDWATTHNRYHQMRAGGKFICFSAAVGYDRCQGFMNSERLLILMAEDPNTARDMFETVGKLAVDTCRMLLKEGYEFDGAFFYNDMGYKNSSLFSPKMYRELIFPIDKYILGFCHENGMKTLLHSCGNVKPLVPFLIEAGLDCLEPLEVKAGMDLIELKKIYGNQLAFMGGIDVRKMVGAAADPTAIEEEIKTKFESAKKGGGYIYHSDHSVPKNVSFQDYQKVMELVGKYGNY
ncbi:MAG: uroporphyrinogen decarboxylase family protein [Candidatus Omnitrophota bacterium]